LPFVSAVGSSAQPFIGKNLCPHRDHVHNERAQMFCAASQPELAKQEFSVRFPSVVGDNAPMKSLALHDASNGLLDHSGLHAGG
jgi:hypothetical protein